ncbi:MULTISPECIES: hypothetical protein [unclassified Sulfuricurvum]|uniref:hypothetical protein n=1 Tax=unclassified Sulfuricurvum TaxID=2632390 RepID=UPI00029961F9|nr:MULTISPECIES: hypothetical protein [unclassified Sulfuricurvum]AFV97524.1 hypothetical protein B649_06050 [Candidatus Sulfuricurvum sp. RIFRC-1]HBM35216.1 hypothetical protein [Sulfuricurvum sp.]
MDTNLNDSVTLTPVVSGIDALQYFAQSGGQYDRFYESLMDQIEDKKAYFKKLNYQYADNDIIVKINDIEVQYSGMGRDGFHWFYHEFFRVAFKDSEKSPNIQNIRVQVNAVGIYTLGLKSQIEYINKVFLKDLTMNIFPITRIDVNMFVQHDFKYLRKEMILSKKKDHHANIAEHASAYELETYYVGKKPFLLRIYNKRTELKQASQIKRELMINHFGVNGLDMEQPIFNVEFEMHREYLKTFGIDTVDQALQRAETLFKHACDQVRLLDLSTITEDQINTPNRRRAETLPIWKHIQDSYSIKEFMQVDTPLEKIEKITYRYSLEDAEKSMKKVLTRLFIHDSIPTMYFMLDVLQKARDDYELKQNLKNLHEEYKEKPDFETELKTYSDEGLQNFEASLSREMHAISKSDPLYGELFEKYVAICRELDRRDLTDDIPF